MHKNRPRKRFGQNFLIDDGVVSSIEKAVSPAPTDHVVEIGPGLGALTRELLSSGCHLDAIELDRDLRAPLLAEFSINERFRLHQGDALTFDFSSLKRSDTPLRVVGNLPYNISTPLLFRLIDLDGIADMHFMLQLEVVQRLTATPGERHWGRLAIMTQLHCSTQMLFEVPPSAFNPPPKVQSAVIRLVPHAAPLFPSTDRDKLARLVTAAFAQRRKTLRNNLKGLLNEAQIASAGADPSVRAEVLDLATFVRLTEALGTGQP